MSQISILVDFAKEDVTNIHNEISLGGMPNFQAQSIASSTGVITKGATKVLSAHAIRHTIKQHGDHLQQQIREQIGVKDTDFDLIPKILTNPDNVTKGTSSNRGEDALIFSKEIQSKYY